MPFTFNEVASVGDVLPNNRHTVWFPALPNGVSGKTLTLRHGTLSLPPWEVGQIIVNLYGWSVAFAGRRQQQNTFTLDFVETTGGVSLKTLLGWQSFAAGFKQPLGYPSATYAVTAAFKAADTTGAYALVGKMYGVWPMTIQTGDFEENTDALHISTTFSVNAIDIDDLVTAEQARSLSTSTFLSSGLSLGSTNLAVPSTVMSGVNIAQKMVEKMNASGLSVQSLVSSFF